MVRLWAMTTAHRHSLSRYFICYWILLFCAAVGWSEAARAQVEHQLIRRMVVFPLKVEMDGGGSNASRTRLSADVLDEAWWQVREELTQSRRFLVASKQFLVKSDVFMARAPLEPADAVILGKLLDAHALVTFQLKERQLAMQVFDGANGLPLWNKTLDLHPSLTVSDQLVSSARKLIGDFIASVPYQGFSQQDPLIGRVVYEEGDVLLTQIDVGVGVQVQAGDPVQWIRLAGTAVAPLFQGGGRIRVFAEGRVVKVEQGIATVEILLATRVDDIKEHSLVRLPREFERLQSQLLIKEGIRGTLGAELTAPEMSPMEQVRRERRPLVTTMSWVSSLAAFLLLAF